MVCSAIEKVKMFLTVSVIHGKLLLERRFQMLAKLTRGNQFTIPKLIVRKAQLQAGRDYLEVVYFNGVIVLKPVDVEERIPPESYEKFLKDVLTIRPGDVVADERTADNVLKRRIKKR